MNAIAWLRGLAVGLVGAAAGWAAAQDTPWRLHLTDESTGTQIFLRERGPELPAFRATARIHARLASLVAVLLDTDAMPEWVYRTRRVVRIEATSPTQGVSQVITAMPWPLLDREAIVSWQLTQDPATCAVRIEGRSAPERLPPAPEYVRMPSFASRWTFTPAGQGDVAVGFEGHGDPGGNLAVPLLRGFLEAAVQEAPLQTVNALRAMVARPAYRDARLPFICEPG